MNLTLVRWLIAHRDVLMECISIVQDFDMESSLISRWDVVDKLARVIIPAIEGEDIESLAFGEPMYSDVDEYSSMSCGADLAALGVDWRTLVSTLLPILIAILKAIVSSDDE